MKSLVFLLPLTILVNCSQKTPDPAKLIFSGACEVHLKSNVKGAMLSIDGVEVGHDEATVNIPCGEKSVAAHKHGFRPYHAYHLAKLGETLQVTVEMDRVREVKNIALSAEAIKIARGPMDFDVEELRRQAAARDGSTSAGAAPVAGALGPDENGNLPDSVEYWR